MPEVSSKKKKLIFLKFYIIDWIASKLNYNENLEK